MNYVESFNLFGTEGKQIPCIKGGGAPTDKTEGAVGCFYMNTDTGEIYKCTSVSDSNYTWEILGSPASRLANVSLPASAWITSTTLSSLHSQVVSIEGVTEYSQVDLTPSIEQLVAFYEKDLAFVTENEDGVVTVYAIGQKPTNDYVIQVTITEVSV